MCPGECFSVVCYSDIHKKKKLESPQRERERERERIKLNNQNVLGGLDVITRGLLIIGRNFYMFRVHQV
ncbi:hypothetical protein ACOSB0_00155, partial [Candidatus Phytoplasma citri]